MKSKKHFKNSLFSLCLLIAMLASVFPLSAVATTFPTDEAEQIEGSTLQATEQLTEVQPPTVDESELSTESSLPLEAEQYNGALEEMTLRETLIPSTVSLDSYELPNNLQDGALYKFKNVASGKYATAFHTSVGANIHQAAASGSNLQSFRIDYEPTSQIVKIRSLFESSSTNLVWNYSSAATNESGFGNVCLVYDGEDYDSQHEWIIVPDGLPGRYKICVASNTSLVLTSYGTGVGDQIGQSQTSVGNIFVSEDIGSYQQRWYIESGGVSSNAYNIRSDNVNGQPFYIQEGAVANYYCPLNNISDSVFWTTNNFTVAEVADDGTVTAKKAGTATIGAYLRNSDGTGVDYTVTINVLIRDGTYFINNVSSDFILRYENATNLGENATLEVVDRGSNNYTPPTGNERYMLFKIKHIGNGEYSIRSMLKSNMGWTQSDERLVVTTIGTTDASVPNVARWKIKYDSDGYMIYSAVDDYYTVTGSDVNYTDIALNHHMFGVSVKQWTFTKITATYEGIILGNNPEYVAKGESAVFSAIGIYSTDIDVNGQGSFRWSISSGTNYASIGVLSGRLSATALGIVTVTVTKGNISKNITIEIISISEGIYYFKNAKHNNYMQINNNIEERMEEDAFFELRDFSVESYQKFSVQYIGNSYYKIICIYSGKALTAPSTANHNITQNTYANLDSQKWYISVLGGGNCKFYPKSHENACMSASDGAFTSVGRNVEMREEKANDGSGDEWILEALPNRAIFILPGMLGSSLELTNGLDIWLHLTNHIYMGLYENGESVYSVVSENKDNYGANDTYQTLYDSLYSSYSNSFDIVFFDYDFRLSIENAAIKLEQEVTFYEEVIFVAHSMGGLVASKYLANSSTNRSKTTALITLGTPFAGSAKCIDVMETGEIISMYILGEDRDLFTNTVRSMSKNCFSSYQLLPTSSYYALTNCYPLTVNNQSYVSAYDQLKYTSWGKTNAGNTKVMFAQSSNFHSSLTSDGTYIINQSDVTVYTLGAQNINTISSVHLDSNYEINGLSYSNSGDGIVMLQSAGYGTPDFVFNNVTHTGLVSNSSVILKIKELITAETGVSASTSSNLNTQSIDVDESNMVSLSNIAVNEKGWIMGYDNRRINIYTNNNANLIANGNETVEIGEFVYDMSGNEIGSVWLLGDSGKKMYALYNGNYVLQDAVFAKVEYMNNGYYDSITEYNTLDSYANIVNVSNYNSKKVVALEICENELMTKEIIPSLVYSTEELTALNAS